MWAVATASPRWVALYGASLLRTAFPDVFALFGTTYGAVDGTHFNLPDCRGRMPVGLGTHADVATIGNNDGLAVGNRRPKHKHTKGGSASVTGAQSTLSLSGSNSSFSFTWTNSSIGLSGSNSSLALTGSNSTITLSGYTAVSATPSSGGTGFTTGDRAIAENFGLGGANSSIGMSGSNSTLSLSGSNSSLSITGANSSLSLAGSNSTIGVTDNITIGPQTGAEPVDSPGYIVFYFIIKT